MHEDGDPRDALIFPTNNDRVLKQLATDIRVIVGNPPYSAGQTSANDDNANLKYPTLDARIESTYAARLRPRRTRSPLRLLHSRHPLGLRPRRRQGRGCLRLPTAATSTPTPPTAFASASIDEFDAIYVYNLRGNQRTAGEQSRKEGGKVFGAGSRATIAIMFLVKTGTKPVVRPATLLYRDIGDYLTREQKLETVDTDTIDTIDWQQIAPNEHGDWINQRRETFNSYAPLVGGSGVLASSSLGTMTNRDSWVYNSSRSKLVDAVKRLTTTVNAAIDDGSAAAGTQTMDPKSVKWSATLLSRARRGEPIRATVGDVRIATYRPFFKQNLAWTPGLIHQAGRIGEYFPTETDPNFGIYNVGVGSANPFSVLMLNTMPDLHVTGAGSGGQFFPRYTYAPNEIDGQLDLGADDALDGYRRIDNVTDSALRDYRAVYGDHVTKDEIFYYVYGLLHSPTYRSEFAADLKKMLPRIPLMRDFAGLRRGRPQARRPAPELRVRRAVRAR